MTTTIAPDLKPDHSEREEWPTLDRDPAHATREELHTRPFDPTQGRKIGSHPYDDPTQGTQDRLGPLRRPHKSSLDTHTQRQRSPGERPHLEQLAPPQLAPGAGRRQSALPASFGPLGPVRTS
jgi:hypothetical protein